MYPNNHDLAAQVKAWRGRVPARQAAAILGIPWRTLENIEFGRGFRYEQLLRHAIQTIDIDSFAVETKKPQRSSRM